MLVLVNIQDSDKNDTHFDSVGLYNIKINLGSEISIIFVQGLY